MPKISAVIITFNEEKNIGRCLDSLVDIADEIIVVDSFSTDKTEAICREKGAAFVTHPFEGHIEQKNHAWQQANFDYVLSVDADEEVSEELKQSILAEKERLSLDGYQFNRLTNYCGKWIRHSGWYPDTKMRLFRKGRGKWGGSNPHDLYLLDDPKSSQHLVGDLLHYTFYTVDEHRAQVKKFTDISSLAAFKEGKRSSWVRILVSPMAKFIRNYFMHRGFLDGYYGLLICSISARATYLKYSKLYQLQKAAGNQQH